uniref:Annexin n=1 Tax=Gallus gallus TaxID=9031 RepID=A0A8V0XZ16_CHICK
MKGLGADGNTLIRVVVFRFKIDILDIGRELLTMYGKSLYSFIKGDCSGDYRNVLLKLCGSED